MLAALLRSPHAAIGVLGGTADCGDLHGGGQPGRASAGDRDRPGTVTTFDTSSRRKLGEYRIGEVIGEGIVQSLAFSPDGETLAVTGRAGVQRANARTRSPRRAHASAAFTCRTAAVPEQVDFSSRPRSSCPADATCSSCKEPPTVRREACCCASTGARETSRELHCASAAPRSTSCRRARRRVFVTSPEDDSTHEIDTEVTACRAAAPLGGFAGALSPDGGALARDPRDGRIRLLDLRSGDPSLRTRPESGRRRYGVHARRPDARLVGLRRRGDRLETSSAGEVSEELSAHRGPVWALAVSPDGRTLYSAGNDGRLILWDLREIGGSSGPSRSGKSSRRSRRHEGSR